MPAGVQWQAIDNPHDRSSAAGPDHSVRLDPNATVETRELFSILRRFAKDRMLFGHQDSTAYGVGWSGGLGNSSASSATVFSPFRQSWTALRLNSSS
jgi:mannan endo-1,4-beta-mannosidase